MCFIYDYNRKGRNYLLAEKSEEFEFFKRYKVAVERETSLVIKCHNTSSRIPSPSWQCHLITDADVYDFRQQT